MNVILRKNPKNIKHNRGIKIGKFKQYKICNYYKDGHTIVQTAKEFGCSASAVQRILKRNNIEARKPRRKSRRKTKGIGSLSFATQTEICKYYQEGYSLRDTGEKFGIGLSTVKLVLTKHGHNCRKCGVAGKKLTIETEKKICELRKTKTLRQLGQMYGISHQVVANILKRYGITKKNFKAGPKEKKISEYIQKEIIRYYCVVNSIVKVADNFNVSKYYVKKILKQKGIIHKRGGQRKLTEDEELEICDYYALGNSMHETSKQFGVCAMTVRRYLLEYAYVIRPHGNKTKKSVNKTKPELRPAPAPPAPKENSRVEYLVQRGPDAGSWRSADISALRPGHIFRAFNASGERMVHTKTQVDVWMMAECGFDLDNIKTWDIAFVEKEIK